MVKSLFKITWLKAFTTSLLSFGGFSAILMLYPTFSNTAKWVGIVATILGIFVTVRTAYTKDWWGQMAFIHIWILLMLGIAVRAFTDVFPIFWLWFGALFVSYCFAWALPFILPKLSSFLLREQLTPKTKLGKGCMSFALAMLPITASLGANIGYYGARYGKGKVISLLGAIMFSIISLGLSQAMAHQMWPHRPWAKQDASEEG